MNPSGRPTIISPKWQAQIYPELVELETITPLDYKYPERYQMDSTKPGTRSNIDHFDGQAESIGGGSELQMRDLKEMWKEFHSKTDDILYFAFTCLYMKRILYK